MRSGTITWPSLRSALAFASRACASAADANVFIMEASACAAGAWGRAADAAGATAGDAAGLPAITTAAATSASTRLIPRVRISTSPKLDFRFDLPDGHTYTPASLPDKLELIFHRSPLETLLLPELGKVVKFCGIGG